MTSAAAPPVRPAFGMGVDATTQTDVQQKAASTAGRTPPSNTLRVNQIRRSYRPPHQLNSPDTSHAESAALLAAQHTIPSSAWTYGGHAGAHAPASLARSQPNAIEARKKPPKLSSAGAAASLAHRANINEGSGSRDKEASASAAAALRTPISGNEVHESSALAVCSPGASLTNSATHALKAASMAHKPSLSKTTEQQKTSPPDAFRGAWTAHRDSAVIKSPSPTPFRTPEESTRIQQLAHELAKRDLEADNAPGGVRRSDLQRVATLSLARKQASDAAEAEIEQARKCHIEEEAIQQLKDQQDLEDAARRIVAERIAKITTLTAEEMDEPLAEKAAEASLMRGNQRVKDWELVLRSLEEEDKTDRENNVGWLRHSMRSRTTLESRKPDPAAIMAAAQRNVKSQLDGMDKSIAAEGLVLGKPRQGETLTRNQATAKALEDKGTTDLERKQKERASTYDVGGLIMTHEQVEAIAQKHVNEVLAEINEKVQREKERIEAERTERESRAREKAHERELARERVAEEKAEKDRLKAEQREAKAAERREKAEAKTAEKKKREDEKAAAKELKTVTKEHVPAAEASDAFDQQRELDEQVKPSQETDRASKGMASEAAVQGAVVSGVMEFDKHQEKEEMKKEKEAKKEANMRLKRASHDSGNAAGGVRAFDRGHEALEARKHLEEEKGQRNAVTGVLDFNQEQPAAREDDPSSPKEGVKGIKGWFNDKRKSFGRRLSRAGLAGALGGDNGPKSPTNPMEEEEEDIYGEQVSITKEVPLRNVAMERPDVEHAGPVETKHEEPAKPAHAEKEDESDDEPPFGPKVSLEPEMTDDDDEENVNDEEENRERKDVVENPSMGILAPSGPMEKVSSERSERASRFKEEF